MGVGVGVEAAGGLYHGRGRSLPGKIMLGRKRGVGGVKCGWTWSWGRREG